MGLIYLVFICRVYRLKPLKSKRDLLEFCAFSRYLYRDDPNFISPLDGDILSILLPDLNSNNESRQSACWLAYKAGEAVGRIAAFFDNGQGISGIGFFDCIEDSELARELLTTAEYWLRANGQEQVQAPINFGQRDRFWGLLINASKRPSFQENYHKPYYRRYFEQNGYVQAFEQTTSILELADLNIEKFRALENRALQLDGIRIEHFDPQRLNKFASDFINIYNRAWADKDFYKALEQNEVVALFKSMKFLIDPELIWFTYVGQEPVSFYLSVPEINPFLEGFKGKLNLWNKLQLWFRLRLRRPGQVRGLAFGIVPEYQAKAVFVPMMMEMFRRLKNKPKIQYLELSWIGDFNPIMHSFFRRINAAPHKLHISYQKHL